MEDRLQKFVQLVDAGGFTKAAERMHISQPALSSAIKKLEKELHAQLFVHDTRPLQVTAAGQLAYEAGKSLITQRINLTQQLAELAKRKIPFRIGMIDSIAEMLFITRELDKLEAWAEVSLSINNSRVLLQAVMQHEIDAALITEQTTLPSMLHATQLGAEPLVLVVRSDMVHTTRRAIAKGILPNFLSYNRASTTHTLIQSKATHYAIELQPRFYSTSPDVMLKLVLAGRGVAALPYLMVRQYCENNLLSPIALGDSFIIERHISVVTHVHRHIPAAFSDTMQRTTTQLQTLHNQAAAILQDQ